jgi:hypothetical protein
MPLTPLERLAALLYGRQFRIQHAVREIPMREE